MYVRKCFLVLHSRTHKIFAPSWTSHEYEGAVSLAVARCRCLERVRESFSPRIGTGPPTLYVGSAGRPSSQLAGYILVGLIRATVRLFLFCVSCRSLSKQRHQEAMALEEHASALEVRSGDNSQEEEEPVVAREIQSRLVQLEEEVGYIALLGLRRGGHFYGYCSGWRVSEAVSIDLFRPIVPADDRQSRPRK